MELILDPKRPLDFTISTGIGNFDGVHLGHRKIIDTLRKTQRSSRISVVTFDPHPQKVLGKRDVPLIFPMEERYKLLRCAGVECVICLPFTETLSKYSAEDFVSKILVGLLRIENIAVGPGFIFGNERMGNTNLLRSMGKNLGFNTLIVEPGAVDGDVVSSTRIRDFIKSGEIEKANRFLGYDYFIKGKVVEGEKRGREIGFPTVNLDSTWELLPKIGVYATYLHIDDRLHQSITNIGYRPTFGDDRLLIESHIFDFDGDLYGKELKLNFVKRLRDEKRFDSVDSLVTQIEVDVSEVKKILIHHLKV